MIKNIYNPYPGTSYRKPSPVTKQVIMPADSREAQAQEFKIRTQEMRDQMRHFKRPKNWVFSTLGWRLVGYYPGNVIDEVHILVSDVKLEDGKRHIQYILSLPFEDDMEKGLDDNILDLNEMIEVAADEIGELINWVDTHIATINAAVTCPMRKRDWRMEIKNYHELWRCETRGASIPTYERRGEIVSGQRIADNRFSNIIPAFLDWVERRDEKKNSRVCHASHAYMSNEDADIFVYEYPSQLVKSIEDPSGSTWYETYPVEKKQIIQSVLDMPKEAEVAIFTAQSYKDETLDSWPQNETIIQFRGVFRLKRLESIEQGRIIWEKVSDKFTLN